MDHNLEIMDEEFGSPAQPTLARVRPHGLRVGERVVRSLHGTIERWRLVRKLYRDDRLQCWSNDGRMAAVGGGKVCAECRDRGQCAPRVRLWIEGSVALDPTPLAPTEALLGTLILEIGYTSCRNFSAYVQHLARGSLELREVATRLRVYDRGHWGEVAFELDRMPGSNGHLDPRDPGAGSATDQDRPTTGPSGGAR